MYSFIQYTFTNPVLLEANNQSLYQKFKEDPDIECNTETEQEVGRK